MRILIVEDEEKLANVLKEGFERGGYTVDCVGDGEVAERRIMMYQNEYDAVILDWMLPIRDGIDVCTNVRKKGVKVPIIMLTGRFDMADKVKALDAGADDYVVKPFSLEELLARVRAVLRRPTQVMPTELKVGKLTLNQNTHRVFLDKKEIRLTMKEFALLEYLMRNPNKVVPRDHVMEHLWGFEFSSFSNVMDVHMKNLRKKINNRKNKIIETVRGVGYQLKDY